LRAAGARRPQGLRHRGLRAQPCGRARAARALRCKDGAAQGMSDIDDARAALLAIPQFAGWGDAEITRLGGLTNRVCRIDGCRTLCLRLPGAGNEEYLDRANEAQAAREAGRAGVSPEVLYADPASGVLVTAFLDGTQTMTPDLFRSRPGATRRAG